ncbi:NAD(P)H-binding protein [Pyxidicoccus fallax]|uniref:NAD(P)H-binding protein n=1 Tax=Pyxidicoccus fallax TaxID=394095 RepID=A0A848LSD3_9BACT|nr:NAD(P)H-binding protein [Pyxidicoccus fallax]NMO20867.1 NAD(P)H-binding protein [Pyxidicoccus fallax]NPC82467.1 NAD(P)H-binding protein [Pyxidicoccus fallax]
MRALIIGGTGQTGSLVVQGLRQAGIDVRTASRNPRDGEQVRFDWERAETHDEALQGVDAVYMVAPAFVDNPAGVMVPFVDRAISRGVRNFVLLSASPVEEGTKGLGTVHAALRARAPGWTVLRPSWFMQNFFESRHHLAQSLATTGRMVTATGRGRVGFIDAADIAAVAVQTLRKPTNSDLILTGPEALSYDDVAAILSRLTGRRLEHRAVSFEETRAHMVASGIPDAYAALLAGMEESISRGTEDRTTDAVLRVTGRPPTPFREVAARLVKPGDAAA